MRVVVRRWPLTFSVTLSVGTSTSPKYSVRLCVFDALEQRQLRLVLVTRVRVDDVPLLLGGRRSAAATDELAPTTCALPLPTAVDASS